MLQHDAIRPSPCEQDCPRWDECLKGLACQAFAQYVDNNRWAKTASFVPDRITFLEVMGDYDSPRWTPEDRDLAVELMLDHRAQMEVVEAHKAEMEALKGRAKLDMRYRTTLLRMKANEISVSRIAEKFGVQTREVHEEMAKRGL